VKIRALRLRAVDIPLDTSIQTAIGTISSSPAVLIDLDTDAGLTGRSYVFCYTPLVLAPMVRLLTNLGDLLLGVDASPDAVGQQLGVHLRLLGATGLVGMAAAGIDAAAWDAAGKAARQPLARLLGSRRESVPAYMGIRSMEPIMAAREAAAAAEAGFGAVKVKLGHPSLDQDMTLVRAVRDAVGPGVQIMVDYNQSLAVSEAQRRGRALDSEGLAWIEEPVSAADDAGHARLAGELRTPIQIGENWWGPEEMARSLAARACDLATFDAIRIGGVTGWLKAASIAEAAGLAVSSHRYPEVSASLLAVTPSAHWLEYVDTMSPVLTRPLLVERGQAVISGEQGLGLEWDERAVARYLMD
jgi:mandelate racemase